MRDAIEHRLFASPRPRAIAHHVPVDLRAHLARPPTPRRWLWVTCTVVVTLAVVALVWVLAIR